METALTRYIKNYDQELEMYRLKAKEALACSEQLRKQLRHKDNELKQTRRNMTELAQVMKSAIGGMSLKGKTMNILNQTLERVREKQKRIAGLRDQFDKWNTLR